MRAVPALAASVIAHAALIATLRATRPSRVVVAPPRAEPIALVEPTPVEIVVLPAPTPTPIAAPDPPARAAAGSPHLAASRSRSTTGETAATATGTGTDGATEPGATGPRTHLLDMRRPERKRLAVDGDALASIANERPAEAVGPVPSSGTLYPSGGGGMIAPDLVTTLRVDPDGSAHFDDKGDGEIHLPIGIPSRHELGALVDGWYADPYAQLEAPPVQELPPHEQAVEGGWDSGGRPGTIGAEAAKTGTIPVAGGGFDITSWAMRKAGMDPYQARKQKLLETTYDERVQMRAVHTDDQLRRAAELMRGNLQRLWRTTLDPAERRRALFELWDECAEGDGPAGLAGQRARTQVIGWIRKRLPAGSTDAYSVDEITRLDANRQSIQAFAPYPP